MNRKRWALWAVGTLACALAAVSPRAMLPVVANTPRTITLTASDRSLSDIVSRIADYFGLSVVIRGKIDRRVTVALRGLSVDEALAAVLKPADVAYDRVGRILEVGGTTPAPRATPTANAPAVLNVTAIPVERAAKLLRHFFPGASISQDAQARTLIVGASPSDVASMRTLLSGIDVRSPDATSTEAIALANLEPSAVTRKLAGTFGGAKFATGPAKTLLVTANEHDMTQIKALVASIDGAAAAKATPAPPAGSSEAVRVYQLRANDVARVVAGRFPSLHVSSAGDSVVLTGPADSIVAAKAIVASIDVPQGETRYTSVYKLRYVDASAVQSLIQRTFPGVGVTVDSGLNIITILADGQQQTRIAAAIGRIDTAPPGTPQQPAGDVNAVATTETGGASANGGTYTIEVVKLKAASPAAAAGSPSTTASEVATLVQQTLGSVASDVHVEAVPNLPELLVSGSPASVKLAKAVIARVDVPQPLVVLDTQILEVTESVAKNLGLSFAPNTVVSTIYTETSPQPSVSGGVAPPLLGLQPLSRTPLSLQFQLGLAISQGRGRILADPRITTLSGKTASIRAGDNITVLTQSGGGTGVAITTQLQTFNTGVSLDITPIVNDDNYVTISLHPVVNNVSSLSAQGIPQISTRDTQTTVGLREGQTLVIGGLIQDSDTRTTTKIPVLADIPIIGKAFRNEQVNKSRDELIITITPHLVDPQTAERLIPLPPPAPLPSLGPYRGLPPGATFPPVPGPTPSRTAVSGEPIVLYGVSPSSVAVPVPPQQPQPFATPPPVTSRATTAPARGVNNGAPPPIGTPINPLTGQPFALGGASGASPGPPGAPTPQPTPSAFGNTNVFTFGQAPTNNYAAASDPAQIFYATFSPTVLSNGTSVSVSAITTTNVNKLTVGYGSNVVNVASVGSGKWQGSYPFSTAGVPAGQNSVSLTLSAARQDGTVTTIAIPVTVTP